MKTPTALWLAVFFGAVGLLHAIPALGQSPSCYVIASIDNGVMSVTSGN
jgi:hypothetical protein